MPLWGEAQIFLVMNHLLHMSRDPGKLGPIWSRGLHFSQIFLKLSDLKPFLHPATQVRSNLVFWYRDFRPEIWPSEFGTGILDLGFGRQGLVQGF